MNILIIGNGGREHALAWKAAQSSQINKIYVAPGNAGTAIENKIENIDIAPLEIDKLIEFAKTKQIKLTFVGPEAPLAAGIVDRFHAAKLLCLGPHQYAAQLESSKHFAKEFMREYHIPTAYFNSFTDIISAKEYIREHGTPIVIKADGLAAGKGVVIAQTETEAFAAIDEMLGTNKFGTASARIVIEEFLQGEEVSFIVLTDGETVVPLPTSQDHKARDDGDRGPNTGGMGAYSPAPIVTAELHNRILNEVITPTLKGMRDRGHTYTGFLYAGLMISKNNDIKVLEFNCRLGDPEAEVILLKLRSDLVSLGFATVNKQLANYEVEWDPRPALGVVLTAKGYPDNYVKGDIITGLDTDTTKDIKVFHSGTKKQHQQIVSHGGRVLCVCALGETLLQAKEQAYAEIKKIHWSNMYFRNDIGHRAL